MKTNISSLMSLIAEQEKKLNNVCFTISEYAVNTTTEELDGRVNTIENNKEIFDLNFQEIENSAKRLSKLKSVLYEKNNMFKLTDGRTIQEAIVDNANLRRVKTAYEELLNLKNTKKRVTEVKNSYFECKTLNFNIKDLKNKIKLIDEQIQKTDFEISKLNSIEFDI